MEVDPESQNDFIGSLGAREKNQHQADRNAYISTDTKPGCEHTFNTSKWSFRV
jgi:hypothetical protein